MARLLALLLILLAAAPPARAAESAPVSSPRATVTLLSDSAAIAPGVPFRLALRQRLAPGWHSYWTNPGDAGAATELNLALPEGWAATPLAFPAPERIPFGPLVNFGFKNEAVLLTSVTPPATLRPGEAVTLEAEGSWLVCEQVCIPEEGRFSLRLPVAEVPRPANAAVFRAADAAIPRPSPFRAEIGFAGPRGMLRLTGDGLGPRAVREAFFFPTAQTVVENAAPQELRLRPGAMILDFAAPAGARPNPIEGVVALTDGAGVRTAFTVSAPPGPLPEAPGLALWQAALFAALGGLILNLMPCVFPVLAMKALSLAKLSGSARREVRLQAGSFTAGVVLSFVAVGGALLVLRAGGSLAGWGFQFTHPGFVAAMAWLMLAVGLNLSGVFTIGGPVGAGQGLAARGGHAGSFFTGVLAVLVATPCTAPFMAGAVAAALAMPAPQTLAVFAAMGLGMALPYALLGAFPGLAARLPRPGAWMARLKEALAFPMYAAAVWLVWVLAQQAGPDGVLLVLAGGVLVAAGAWALGAAQAAGRGRLGLGLAGVGVAAALALLPRLDLSATAEIALPHGAEPWSPARLAELRAEGRPVFVNATAAWCVSCKVNERLVLDTSATRAAFAEHRVAVLVADWTRGDAAISALLRAHGREGVPLYLLYPAGGGEPELLPQILTEGILRDALLASAPASFRLSSDR
jgi:thiol:disulfide interchange protein DsbD